MKRISTHRKCPRERIIWWEILAGNVWNLPWSRCVKTQRDISVNGEKEDCRTGFYD